MNVLFDPFLDRLSRDIRNDLSATVPEVLDLLDLEPAKIMAEKYLNRKIAKPYKAYIIERLAGYASALEEIKTGGSDRFWRSLVFWDRKFFFEVHELLENEWYLASGKEKKILQAMIRAAGVYIKLEYGYSREAGKIADRALPVIRAHQEYFSRYFDPKLLIESLENLKSEPPILLRL